MIKNNPTKFIPGLELNRMFYADVVGPLMKEHFPHLKYSAALNGHGSDVLGFDTPKSMDHNWGPHLNMFFRKKDFRKYAPLVNKMLRKNLPYTYKGFSTNFSKEDPEAYLKQRAEFITSGEVNHIFRFFTIQSFLRHYIYFDRDDKIEFKDWLIFPEQALIEITAGEIYYDGLNELEKMRNKFEYYPNDIWIYAMRVQWGKIVNELAFQARSGEEEDELGSMVLAGHMVQTIMQMVFLMEKKYAPYRKWFGTAFSKLDSAKKFQPLLEKIVHSSSWKERQELFARCYQMLGEVNNNLGITKPVSTEIKDFHGRGYPMVDPVPYIKELEKAIKNKKLKNMKYPLGLIDQFIDHAKINQENYVYKELKVVME
ncbi:MAG: hypothetical protein JWO40_11 [Candidatus Doudnabacteria bacterium]|nr:hypothetical protein [Candidatus Doudnabacteria bacterium]